LYCKEAVKKNTGMNALFGLVQTRTLFLDSYKQELLIGLASLSKARQARPTHCSSCLYSNGAFIQLLFFFLFSVEHLTTWRISSWCFWCVNNRGSSRFPLPGNYSGNNPNFRV
jgi:hypothetical protein